ncbi:hypothetical protein GUJ93_ZPchr0009g1354 [Zizania palustris]|uniref:Co-chaperone HscB C-terminal oligomerisation domain-containing protein n=1 Tax=Zizania palustris TaxID=103762 RepID=A0A8J5VMI8_ZIZPA|nr:hypothetical protein GUJ93_ZPchr0009g1354 [Zizania palustris]
MSTSPATTVSLAISVQGAAALSSSWTSLLVQLDLAVANFTKWDIFFRAFLRASTMCYNPDDVDLPWRTLPPKPLVHAVYSWRPVAAPPEREYNIKDNNLEGKYKNWQKKLHPDLVHSKSEKERAFAAEQSTFVIDAYRTLSKPLPRALYLLQLEGIHIDEEKTITDPELLMEMMEIREAVNEASDSQTLEKIQSQIKRKFETWSNSFEEAFDKRDFDHGVKATQRMRYYERAMEEAVKKL